MRRMLYKGVMGEDDHKQKEEGAPPSISVPEKYINKLKERQDQKGDGARNTARREGGGMLELK